VTDSDVNRNDMQRAPGEGANRTAPPSAPGAFAPLPRRGTALATEPGASRGGPRRSPTTLFRSGIGVGSRASVPMGGHRMSTILRTLRRATVAAAILVP